MVFWCKNDFYLANNWKLGSFNKQLMHFNYLLCKYFVNISSHNTSSFSVCVCYIRNAEKYTIVTTPTFSHTVKCNFSKYKIIQITKALKVLFDNFFLKLIFLFQSFVLNLWIHFYIQKLILDFDFLSKSDDFVVVFGTALSSNKLS